MDKWANEQIGKSANLQMGESGEMVELLVEQEMLENLSGPDSGLELGESVRDRLLRQQEAVAAGERGEPFEDVARRLGLAKP